MQVSRLFRKFSALIRSSEWWEYKIPPILVAVYLIVLNTENPGKEVYFLTAFILASLASGAIYVSIINDAADISDDLAAGKSNRIASMSKMLRIITITFSLLLVILPLYFLSAYPFAALLYFLSCLSFTLYSLPPFRLKRRGIWGVFADAAGSQCFPTLYAAVLSSNYLSTPFSSLALVLLGVWSMCYGLRGILWHQFSDMEFDKRSGVTTLPHLMNDFHVRITGWSIITLEITALIGLFVYFRISVLLIVFLFYLLHIFVLYTRGVKIILIRHTTQRHTIFLIEFYHVLLPLTLLALCVQNSLELLPLAIAHLLLFIGGVKRFIRNVFIK